MEGIPDPSKSAKTINAISLTVLAEFVPGGSAFRDLVGAYQSKRIERYRQLLLREIQQRGLKAIDQLSDEQVDFIVPASYRFFEQVRLGEYHHNLVVLAGFVAQGVTALNKPEPGDVGRFARHLEHLSEFELGVMANALSIRELSDAPPEYDFLSAEVLLDAFPSTYTNVFSLQLRSALAILASRGLICPDGSPQLGKTEETYFLTPQGQALGNLVRQMKVD